MAVFLQTCLDDFMMMAYLTTWNKLKIQLFLYFCILCCSFTILVIQPHIYYLRFWSCLLTWSVTMPTCIHYMYHTIQNVGSITNHNPWHRYQWFITLETYWSHCDVTVMHLKFVSLLIFSFVKNSTETTSVLRPQVNIL